jgi:hypothetical protein
MAVLDGGVVGVGGAGGSGGLVPTEAGADGGGAGVSEVAAAAASGRALAAVLLTPRLVVVRREEGCRGVGVAMAGIDGRGQGVAGGEGRAGGHRDSAIWIPEINDPTDRQVGLQIGIAGGEASC